MDFVSPVLKLVGSQLIAEYAKIHGISDKLESWGEKLPGIQAVLDSAEEKQMYDDDPATAQWLADLRDVAYDMEDLLDHFSVKAKGDDLKARSSRLPRCLITCCSPFRPRTLISRHRMADEIDNIDRRLEQVVARIPILGLVQSSRREPRYNQPRFKTSSLPEPKFVGREKQMKELLARLTRSEATHGSVRPFVVVSIVGMGGLGKTTLAQELYNHKSLNFTVKAWACVSDVFDVAAITKSILDQITPSSPNTEKMDLNKLQNSLQATLSGKKFLIVLDDVWNEEYVEIETLLRPLYSGSEGSRIVLTTRNSEVARKVGDRNPKQLDILSEEDCLSLLAYHSIGEENFEGHPDLRDIAVELANKCKGLPLSIKVIGGLLRFEKEAESWRRVLRHGIWNLKGKVPSALKLSYIHLPIDLKRCFAACALFPKDYVFDQDELIQLWIIQGLLQKGTAETYQEVGMENLHRLEAASFLQKARNKKASYSMHDLINDLAKSIDPRSYLSSDENKGGSTLREDKVRHAAMVTTYDDYCISKRFDVFRTMRKLRTFMPFQISEESEPNVSVSEDVIKGLIVDMKNLRMLSLRYFRITQVLDRIGELKLLRSIDFSHTKIQILPESICDLVELQSLLLRGCKALLKLPRNIHRLVNLLHLDIRGASNLQDMPPFIGELTNLEILSDFIVGKEVGQELKQLGPLGCLQQELHVRNLQHVHDVEDAKIANVFGKGAVRELSLEWEPDPETSREEDHQFKLLHNMQPPNKIESLFIHGYGAKRFPSWFNNPGCMENVRSITLKECRNVESLPPFGQLPLLERLEISRLGGISSIGPEFYGSRGPFFQSLKKLSFEKMGSWEKWLYDGGDENSQPFPCLVQLIVNQCPKLKGGCALNLPSLVEINIDGCDRGLLTCLEGLTSMTKMKIRKIRELVHFEGSLATSWVALEEMEIDECPRFKSIVEGDEGKQVPPKLNVLQIDGCGELVKLTDDLCGLTSLTEMRIVECPRFKSFAKQVPPNLKVLEIRGCGEIEELPDDLCGLTSLSELSVINCEKLCSFSSGGLPSLLRRLYLEDCPNLSQSQLNSIRLLDYLEDLTLWNMEGLVSITELVGVGSPLSRSLRKLEIHNCRSLTTLTDSLQHLSALSSLDLWNCPALEMEIFPSLPCNLSKFSLRSCPNVKSLPHDMHHLTSLKILHIRYCEGITSLSSRGGLPPNLEVLGIERCRNLNQPIEEWGLRGLTALRELEIHGEMKCVDEMECFPPPAGGNDDVLPSSLHHLTIGRMKKLKRVGGGLRHHLSSLKELDIMNCERLRCLPDDGLPESLESLYIGGCTAELVEKWKKGKGEYWHSHLRLIPRVEIWHY